MLTHKFYMNVSYSMHYRVNDQSFSARRAKNVCTCKY